MNQALAEHACPLCGAPNACAVAQAGSFEVECWCKNVTFSTRALERVPQEKRGKACLCARCAALK